MKPLGRAASTAYISAVVVGTLALGREGAAQEEAAPSSPLEEITVTGSRIRAVSGMNTPVPVTVITAEQIAFSAPGGLVEALDKMPQFSTRRAPARTRESAPMRTKVS